MNTITFYNACRSLGNTYIYIGGLKDHSALFEDIPAEWVKDSDLYDLYICNCSHHDVERLTEWFPQLAPHFIWCQALRNWVLVSDYDSPTDPRFSRLIEDRRD